MIAGRSKGAPLFMLYIMYARVWGHSTAKNGTAAKLCEAKWAKNEENARYYSAKSKYLTFLQKTLDIAKNICYNVQVLKN